MTSVLVNFPFVKKRNEIRNSSDGNKQHGMEKLIKYFPLSPVLPSHSCYFLPSCMFIFRCYYSLSPRLLKCSGIELGLTMKILKKEGKIFQSLPQMSFVCFGIRR